MDKDKAMYKKALDSMKAFISKRNGVAAAIRKEIFTNENVNS